MRRRLLIAAGVLVFLAAAYTVYWNVMASRAAGWIALWAAPAPGKSWDGSFASAETGGFPFTLRVRLTQPEITWQGPSGHATWQGPWLVASFRPWSLSRFELELPDQQTVQVSDGADLRMIALAMSEGRGAVEVADNRARVISGTFEDVVATLDQGHAPVAARRLDFRAEATEPDKVWSLSIEGDDIRLAGWSPEPFGATIGHVQTKLRINGYIPGGTLADRLAGWRDGGGTVDVDELKLDWPPLKVDANGTLALDGQMRPIGAFTAQIEGYRELLGALEQAGQLQHSQAVVAGSALDAMARQGDDGIRQLSIPVSIQNGRLFAGPIPIVAVPPLLPQDAGF